jgi:hypothetical protein
MEKRLKKPSGYRFAATSRTGKEMSYLTRLEQCVADSSFSNVEKMMNFPLYVPRQNLTNALIRYEIFKRVLSVQGSVVECGVFFGGGLMSFAQFSAILEPTNHQRRIIGFDTFAGFPRLAPADAKGESPNLKLGGLGVDAESEINECVNLFDENRFVGHIPKVELVRGDASKTIPAYVKRNPHLVVSLLYLDFDIYAPTLAALRTFVPRMPKGAVIAFDELNLKDWPGETVAVMNELGLGRLRIERFPFGSTISFAQLE